jgi:hypothetical protein
MTPRHYWRHWPFVLLVAAVMAGAYFVGALVAAFG